MKKKNRRIEVLLKRLGACGDGRASYVYGTTEAIYERAIANGRLFWLANAVRDRVLKELVNEIGYRGCTCLSCAPSSGPLRDVQRMGDDELETLALLYVWWALDHAGA